MEYVISEDTQLGMARIDMQPHTTKYVGIVARTIAVDITELDMRFTMMDLSFDQEGRILDIEFY